MGTEFQPVQRFLCGGEAAESAPAAFAVGCGLRKTGKTECQETWVQNPPFLKTTPFPLPGFQVEIIQSHTRGITLSILLGCSENRMGSWKLKCLGNIKDMGESIIVIITDC